MEAKYGDMSAMSSGDDEDGKRGGPAVDMRQDRIFQMNTKEIYAYIVEKTNMTEETASKILECGLTGPMIEIALMDGELEEVISDMGFAPLQMRNLSKVLKFDGWKAKESYPITMSGAAFGAWMSVYKGKKKVSQPQKIRIRQARKQKYEKRRLEKAARQRPMK